MKNKWGNYSLKDGKIKSSYIREYSSRSPKWEANEASRSNSLFQIGQVEKEIEFISDYEVKDGRICSDQERSRGNGEGQRSILALQTLPKSPSDSRRETRSSKSNSERLEKVEEKMKESEKKMLVKHINKDDKEFRAQIKDDVKLKKEVTKSKTQKRK